MRSWNRGLGALALAGAACGALGLASVGQAQPEGGSVTFVIDQVRSNKGHVRVDICTEETFLKANCPYSAAAPAVKGVTTVTLANLPPGTYAAQVYHDHADKGGLARGPLGIPLDEFGFSEDAAVGLHGPRFAKAAFVHGAEDQTLTVRLKHYG